MTMAHLLYIPGVLGVGLVIGFILGGRASELRKDDSAECDARKAARNARRRASAD